MNFRHSWILLFEFPATEFVTTNYTVTQINYLYILQKQGHFLGRLALPKGISISIYLGHPVNLLGLSEQKFVSDLPLQIPK